ncbi:MAG: sulfatase-like hydrolase/transferase, partial [bacterium]|nr:sulfatase-like hydrolase/transferase [bacterium]
SFLTGQHAHRHGITHNYEGPADDAVDHRLITFPRLLQRAGYETAYVGKWHIGHEDDSRRPGFDHWISFPGQGLYVDPPLNINGQRVRAKGYMTDILTGHAVDYLRREHTRPFCLYIGHKAVHAPFTPAERHQHLYSTEPLPRTPAHDDSLAGKPELQPAERDGTKRPGS